MSSFCADEPWSARTINGRISFTAAASQDIWPDHPEKVLGTRREWIEKYPHTTRALVSALLEASRWIDVSEANKCETVQILAHRAWLGTKEGYLTARIPGEYNNGADRRWRNPRAICFFRDGETSFPRRSDGMWFLTQFRCWGLLKQQSDYATIAACTSRIDIWRNVAVAVGRITPPTKLLRIGTLMDSSIWDGRNPEAYANSFTLRRTRA